MIKVTYIDASTESFERSGYYLYTETDNDDDEATMLKIYKNKLHPSDDDFDEDDSEVVIEIALSQVRKIEYDD